MELTDLRQQINQLDDELSALFARRMQLAEQVAQVKAEKNLPLVDPQREREIISRLTQNQTEPFAGYTKMLFTTLFDLSRAHQTMLLHPASATAMAIKNALATTPQLFPKQAVVACQGAEGANSTFAAEKLFARPSIMYFNSFDGVGNAVDKGLCRYGILPIENSLHGSVTDVYTLLQKYQFYIVRSVKMKINHALLVKSGTALSAIKKVYSHPQALAQCSEFLQSLAVEICPCENTAMAAKFVAESERRDVAAIAAANCAELYGLTVLEAQLQNSDNNYTRFICIAKDLEIYPGARRISLIMTLPHRPGALHHLIAKFSALGINLVKLESRPLPASDFEFMFYFDLDVSVYDEAVFNLFSQLENEADKFVFLGCYAEM